MVNVAAFFVAETTKLRKQIEETKYRLTPIQDELVLLEAKLEAYGVYLEHLKEVAK